MRHPALLALGLLLGACSLSLERAALPADWQGQAGEPLAVEGFGTWARLRGKPKRIGDYSISQLRRSWWDNLPVTEREALQLGDATIGQSHTRQDAAYHFVLLRAGLPQAAIQCRQTLDIRAWQGRLGDVADGELILSGTHAYLGTLACSAQAIAPDWPRWRLDLRTFPQRPLFGILRLGELSHAVIGSQEAASGPVQETAAYLIQEPPAPPRPLDRMNAGLVRARAALDPDASPGLVAAAAALLLASDPVELLNADPVHEPPG